MAVLQQVVAFIILDDYKIALDIESLVYPSIYVYLHHNSKRIEVKYLYSNGINFIFSHKKSKIF